MNSQEALKSSTRNAGIFFVHTIVNSGYNRREVSRLYKIQIDAKYRVSTIILLPNN